MAQQNAAPVKPSAALIRAAETTMLAMANAELLTEKVEGAQRKILEANEYYEGEHMARPPREGEPSPANVGGQSVRGEIRFDAARGLGAVPDTANVEHQGFVVMMTPERFLEFAPQLVEGASEFVMDAVKRGEAIAPAFLVVDVDLDAETPVVVGHEGRNRMAACKAIHPRLTVPVHVFVRRAQARHVTPEIIGVMRRRMRAQASGMVYEGNFGNAFHQGRTLHMPRRITDPKWSWTMGDADFEHYMEACRRAYAELGLRPLEADKCPALEAQELARLAIRTFMDMIADEINQPALKGPYPTTELLTRAVNISLAWVAPYVSSSDQIMQRHAA